jgi:purine-binding chemotaxis protein CheW
MSAMEQQLVVFDLTNEHYGVNIGAVESVIKMQPITAVPRAPSFVEGVTNVAHRDDYRLSLHHRHRQGG